MTIDDEAQIKAIWRGRSITSLQMTPEQLRKRSARFDAAIRRRNLRDQISFALVAVICAFGLAMQGVLVRVGSVLLMGWALFSLYTLHRFGAAAAAPTDSSAQTCAAFHRRQLERQRDIALSWPWGIGLAIPGVTLVGVGGRDWQSSAAMIGVFLFLYVGVVIFGKIRAAEWQREIDSLRSMIDRDA